MTSVQRSARQEEKPLRKPGAPVRKMELKIRKLEQIETTAVRGGNWAG